MTRTPTTAPYVGDVDPEGRLARFWSGSGGLLCVVGPAGVGKSRALRELAARLPCTWVDGDTLPESLDPTGPLVLDGCDGLGPDALARCVGISGSRPVLLARRTPTGDPAEQLWFVRPLAPDPAVELLQTCAERHHPPASHLSRDGLQALAQQLDGLPLALEAAARCLDVSSAEALAAMLEQGDGALVRQLRGGWHTTWEALDPQHQRALRTLSTCAGGFDLVAAAALWETDLAETSERVRRLRACGAILPSRSERPRFEVPVSLASIADEGWNEHDRRAAWRIHADHYGGATDPADSMGLPERWKPRPPVEELGNLEAVCAPQRGNPVELALRAAIAHSMTALRGDDVERSVSLLQDLLERCSELDDGAVWSSRLHLRLGFLHVTAGDASLAAVHLERAQRTPPSAPSDRRDLAVLQMLAWAHWRRGAPADALAVVRRGAASALEAGSFHEVDFLGFQAMIHAEAGRLDDSSACLARMNAHATTPGQRTLCDVWRDACARQYDPPVTISPDSIGLPPRVVLTTTLAKGLSLLWLGRTREVRALFARVLPAIDEPRLLRTRDALLAACAVVDADPPFALEAFEAALFDLDTQNCPEGACRYRLLRAGALWRAASTSQAAQQLAFALEEAERCGLFVVRDEFRLVQAVCAAELGGGDADAVRRLAGAQPMRWYADLHACALALVEGRTPPATTDQGLRWSHQLLHRVGRGGLVAPAEAPSVVELVVGPDCRWFEVGSRRADLRRRRIARRFLTALLERHQQVPGAALSHEDAIEAGWPGERMLPESAAARLHTLAWQLRRQGLSGLLLTSSSGYALRRDVRVQWEDPNLR